MSARDSRRHSTGRRTGWVGRWVSALAIGAVAVGGACQEPAGVVNGPLASVSTVAKGPANRRAVQAVSGALKCQPLGEDSVTQVVGKKGGTIQVGAHTLSIPAGALDQPVAITAVAPSDTINLVQFQPEGLRFERSATLTLSFANCEVDQKQKVRLQVAYLNDSLQIVEYLESKTLPKSSQVQAQLYHFSNYAVAF